jgi:hypothetical protein
MYCVTLKQVDLFDGSGELDIFPENEILKSTIVLIISVKSGLEVKEINLELRRCGFYLSHSELVNILNYLTDKKIIKEHIVNMN